MVKISILLPTRERPSLVYRLFESLIQTTSDPGSIEIVLYMDEDDTPSHRISHPVLNITRLIKPPGNSFGSILRKCYKASSGRYVMLMNDDAVFRTKNWDISVTEAFAVFQDDIAFVYGNDLDQGERVSTFPILSRKACEIMGGICPEGYKNLHIESHLFDIFNHLKHIGHKRIVYLNDVIFEHLHYVLGKSAHDKTYVKKDTDFDDRLFISLADERRYTAMRLAKYIEGQNNGQIESSEKNINEHGIYHDMPKPLVSVVVPVSYDYRESTFRCLDAIINGNTEKTPFEVIVVSMGLTDEMPSYLLNLQGKTKIVCNREKYNFAKVCNQGAKEARGDYLIFLSSGNVPEPGWLDVLVRISKTNNDIAVVGCKILNPRNGRIQHAGICFFNDRGKLKITYIYRGFKADNPVVNKTREFQAISSDCMLVKKYAFLDVGGFDENINSMEDIDLCLKIRERGMKVVYTPEAILYYYGDVAIREDKTYLQNSSDLIPKWADRIKPDLDRFLQEDGFFIRKIADTYYMLSDTECKMKC